MEIWYYRRVRTAHSTAGHSFFIIQFVLCILSMAVFIVRSVRWWCPKYWVHTSSNSWLAPGTAIFCFLLLGPGQVTITAINLWTHKSDTVTFTYPIRYHFGCCESRPAQGSQDRNSDVTMPVIITITVCPSKKSLEEVLFYSVFFQHWSVTWSKVSI